MGTDRGWGRLYAAGWLVSAAATAVALRLWQIRVRDLEARAEEAERTKEETAHRRAMEERLRIARDLHDSLTHSISVIKVQAGVAAHLAEKRGEPVPPALQAIAQASADATRELRATLSALRERADADTGLEQLPELLERARSSGVPVTLTQTGTRGTVPTTVDQAAYRIIQEALTNVGRHAGPAATTVSVAYLPRTLTVQVDNDGPRLPQAPAPGLGLIGMRERVTALGGRLRAEPRTEGGFSVIAELPLGATP